MAPVPDERETEIKSMSFEQIEHELRTPLAAMRSLSEIIRDYPDLGEEQRQHFLAASLAENERLARMVDRLLGSPALRRGIE